MGKALIAAALAAFADLSSANAASFVTGPQVAPVIKAKCLSPV